MEPPETQDSPAVQDKQVAQERGAATVAPATQELAVWTAAEERPAEMEMTDDQDPWVPRVTQAHEAVPESQEETASPADPGA